MFGKMNLVDVWIRVSDPDHFVGSIKLLMIWIRKQKPTQNHGKIIFSPKNIAFLNIYFYPNPSRFSDKHKKM